MIDVFPSNESLTNLEFTQFGSQHTNPDNTYGLGNMTNGVREGSWWIYDQHDQPHSTGNYLNGQKVGPWTIFNSDGTVKSVINF